MHVATSAWGLFAVLVLAMLAVDLAFDARAAHVSGTVRSQVEGEPVREYRSGETWTAPPHSRHIVSANASKTKPARLMAYVIADDSAKATVYDK